MSAFCEANEMCASFEECLAEEPRCLARYNEWLASSARSGKLRPLSALVDESDDVNYWLSNKSSVVESARKSTLTSMQPLDWFENNQHSESLDFWLAKRWSFHIWQIDAAIGYYFTTNIASQIELSSDIFGVVYHVKYLTSFLLTARLESIMQLKENAMLRILLVQPCKQLTMSFCFIWIATPGVCNHCHRFSPIIHPFFCLLSCSLTDDLL